MALRRLFARFVLREVDAGLVLVPELPPGALEQLLAEAPANRAAAH